jgi:hypothetical protein
VAARHGVTALEQPVEENELMREARPMTVWVN